MNERDSFVATTRGIRVAVRAFYLAEQSMPESAQFVWAYQVEIANLGRETVQLIRRTWQITDGTGHATGARCGRGGRTAHPGTGGTVRIYLRHTTRYAIGFYAWRLSHGGARYR
jgi:hypothetical protein